MLDCNHTNKTIEKRLESIYSLHNKKMDFRLDKGPYIDLLKNLGDPHLNLPPVIHVAGTNGKGSTIAFLKSLLEDAGLKVHVYTSPHLIEFNERITLAGKHIDNETLLNYLDLIDAANNGNSLTFFEYTTALAFKAFADYPADICLLETGLGGRLDCTNVVPTPIATIITPIGYDHTEWLGDDIKVIAGEKAGIMKPKTPCFIAPQKYDVNDVFKQTAKDVGCDIHFVKRLNNLPPLGLTGDHQVDNASVAIQTLLSLNLINQENITALQNTKWPARMEQLSSNPDIWFDCGHNADGAQTIANQLKSWKNENPDQKIHLVLGLASDKNPNEFLSPIAPYIDSITCVDLLNARNPQSGKDLAGKIDMLTNYYISIGKKGLRDNINKKSKIIITGSLYLYGWAKRNFKNL